MKPASYSISLGATRSLIAILFVILIAGCTPHLVVNVNAITDPAASQPGKRYVLVNANDVNSESDLYFQEFRIYFDHLLSKNGYIKADDAKDADLEIRFHYGVSDGTTGIQHYSWPIYDTFGGEQVTITERITDSSGTRTIRRTVYIPPHIRQIGSAHEAQSYTIYNRYLNLAAFPVKGNTTTSSPLWNLNIYSVGESNDLRAIMPYLAVAANSYLGKNSGQQQSLTISSEDPLLIELRQLISQ